MKSQTRSDEFSAKKKQSRKTQTILFDFDGVIVDAGETIWSLYQELRESFGLPAYKTREELLARSGRSIFFTLRAHGLPLWKMPQALLLIRHFLKHDYTPRLIPEMKDVITTLAESAQLIIVTSNNKEVVARLLKAHHIKEKFQQVYCGNFRFSKVKLLQEAKKQVSAQVKEQKVIFITDTVHDVADAKLAGIPCYGVSWGLHTPEQLRTAGVLRVFTKPDQIPQEVLGVAHG